MPLQISNRINSSDWDSMIRSMNGSIFHSSTWAEFVIKETPNQIPRFIMFFSEDGVPIGAALGFESRSSNKIIAPLTKRLQLDAVPIIRGDDNGILYDFINALVIYVSQNGYVELSIGSFESQDITTQLRMLSFNISNRMEFKLRLDVSEYELTNGLEYKRKKNIKKAAAMGVTIHDLSNAEGISWLRRLQGESGQRILQRGGPDVTYKGSICDDPVQVLIDSGFGRIRGAKVNGLLVSAGLFTCFNDIVYHTLSGHSKEALETQASTYLLWETMKQYRAEGAKIFNLGGCKAEAVDESSPEHGVYVYKKAFGAETVLCTSGKKILKRNRVIVLNKVRALFRH
jgi:hypothetical protein